MPSSLMMNLNTIFTGYCCMNFLRVVFLYFGLTVSSFGHQNITTHFDPREVCLGNHTSLIAVKAKIQKIDVYS